MEKIDLSGFTYEQLCELEGAIAKRKKDFVSLKNLFVYDGYDGEPHLCYCSKYGSGTNPFYAGYYPKFSDIFTEQYVYAGFGRKEESLLHYLTSMHIPFENRYYSKEELVILWETIKMKLLSIKLDEEQVRLDEKRKQLQFSKIVKNEKI